MTFQWNWTLQKHPGTIYFLKKLLLSRQITATSGSRQKLSMFPGIILLQHLIITFAILFHTGAIYYANYPGTLSWELMPTGKKISISKCFLGTFLFIQLIYRWPYKTICAVTAAALLTILIHGLVNSMKKQEQWGNFLVLSRAWDCPGFTAPSFPRLVVAAKIGTLL